MQLKTPDSAIRDWLYATLHENLSVEEKVVATFDGVDDLETSEELVFGQSVVTPNGRTKDQIVYDCEIQLVLRSKEPGTYVLDLITKQIFSVLQTAAPDFRIDLGEEWSGCALAFETYITLPAQHGNTGHVTERIIELRFTCQ